jgi:type I restriction enzyme S subunit
MNFEWKECTLGDLVTFQRGHDLAKSEFQNGEFPIAGSNGIIGYHNKFTTTAPCITIGRSGNLGTPYFYEKNIWAHNTTLFVKQFHNSDPKFIYYLLKTLDFRQYNSGSAVPSLNRNYVHPIKVVVPASTSDQRRIGKILSSLDDKIELNRQTNQTLEAIAQAIFKEWFVDFNFPDATGEMQNSELGKIPKGWKVYKIGELVNTVSITHKFPKGKAIFLNTSDIAEGKILHHNYSNKEGLPGQAKKSIKKLDILFTEIRPANKRYALIDFDADDFVVSTKLMVLRTMANIHPIVIYNFLTNGDTLKELQHLAESRSGTFPQITFDQVKELKLVLPANDLLKTYEKSAWSIFNKIKSNEEQTKTLTQLRDSLLPKLMTGEIKIN